jgi:hypothetical protein
MSAHVSVPFYREKNSTTVSNYWGLLFPDSSPCSLLHGHYSKQKLMALMKESYHSVIRKDITSI